MIEKIYYQRLIKENFVEPNIDVFRSYTVPDDVLFLPADSEGLKRIFSLMDQIEARYGFNMKNTSLINYKQFALWQANLMTQSEEAALTAVELVMLCCLADKILDSRRFSNEQKQYLCNKMKRWDFINQDSFENDLFPEFAMLGTNISCFLTRYDSPEVRKICERLRLAVHSEIYMANSGLQTAETMNPQELPLLINKSTEFETSAFLTAAIPVYTTEVEQAAVLLGRIFWLIDDLCDFIEDINAGRRNSLLLYCVDDVGETSLSQRIDRTVLEIEKPVKLLQNSLTSLKQIVDETFWGFIVDQIRRWLSSLDPSLSSI